MVPGFHIFRLDRTAHGGGVIIYIRKTIAATQLLDIQDRYVSEGLEVIIIQLKFRRPACILVIIGIYRPPQAKHIWFDVFNNLLQEITSVGKVIVMGDINCDLRQPLKYPTKELINSLTLINLKIHSDEPTRITLTTASCLDLIALDESIICNSYVVDMNSSSDHFPVTASIIATSMNDVKPIVKRSFRKIDFSALASRIDNIHINDSTSMETDDLLMNWEADLNTILDEVVPYKQYPMRRHRSPWITSEIKDLMHYRDSLARKFKKYRDEITLEELKLVKRVVKSRIRGKAREQGKLALASKNPRVVWDFIKKATFTTSGNEIAHVTSMDLNQYFASVVNSTSSFPTSHPLMCENNSCFNFDLLNQNVVQKALLSVKENTAMGHDLLPGYFIKKLASAFAPNLTKIFNASLSQGVFPNTWKKANVTGIYKNKGKMNDPTNYRPISVLPIFGRVFEKLVASQLYNYCEFNEIIPVQQFGFRRSSSCEMALLTASNSWLQSIDQGLFVGALLLDMSKAFDTVPHQMLLDELVKIGCGTNVISWFFNYLSNRTQRVINHNENTPWMSITRGVPQGSCLSPLLFNIFVRDLPASCTSDTFQFADDTTLSEADSSLDELCNKLTASFSGINEYCKAHGLLLNVDKTQLIVFKSASKALPDNFQLTLDDNIITPSKTVKLLGITLDQHLTFGPHIKDVQGKCNGLLGVLGRSVPFLPVELLRLIYTSTIRSVLEYGNALYLPVAQCHLNKLDIIEKKAARIILRQPKDAHSEPLLTALHLEPLKVRRKKYIIKLISSIISGRCHPAAKLLIDIHSDGTLAVPSSNLAVGRRRFAVAGANVFNDYLRQAMNDLEEVK